MAKINNGTSDPKRCRPGRSNTVYAKGATVFLQDSAADSVFYLRKGKIKIAATSPQGKEAIVAVAAGKRDQEDAYSTRADRATGTASRCTRRPSSPGTSTLSTSVCKVL
jgi:CRP-like cAMP-binding protein